MKAQNKKFILKKLIPFILREAGNGFAMSAWHSTYTKSDQKEFGKERFDHVDHRAPICGSVACLGGSAQILSGGARNVSALAKVLGLSPDQADGLFFRWQYGVGTFTAWPLKYQQMFNDRKTPLGKARVAVALLREVVRTNGACLNPVDNPDQN